MSSITSRNLSVARTLLHDIGYIRPDIVRDPNLDRATRKTIASWGFGDQTKGLERRIDIGTSLIEYCYAHHPFDLKLHNVLMTCFLFYIDDVVADHTQALQEFFLRFQTHQPQLLPLLDEFAKLIRNVYEFYEPFVADQMVISAARFPANCVLEFQSSQSKAFRLSKHAKRWPNFIRTPAGMSEYYTYAPFDKKTHPNVLEYVQIIPELLIFLNLTNDVLSAHKEEMAGEEHNMISFISQINGGKDKIEVIKMLATKAATAHDRVSLMLAHHPVHFRTWMQYATGYIAFHIDLKRYALPKSLDGPVAKCAELATPLTNGLATPLEF